MNGSKALSLTLFGSLVACMLSCMDATRQDGFWSVSRISSEISLALPKESKIVEVFEPDRFVDPAWIAKSLFEKTNHIGNQPN